MSSKLHRWPRPSIEWDYDHHHFYSSFSFTWTWPTLFVASKRSIRLSDLPSQHSQLQCRWADACCTEVYGLSLSCLAPGHPHASSRTAYGCSPSLRRDISAWSSTSVSSNYGWCWNYSIQNEPELHPAVWLACRPLNPETKARKMAYFESFWLLTPITAQSPSWNHPYSLSYGLKI